MSELLLEIAGVMSRRGTCSRAQVGVVAAIDDRIVATAYNGAPRGMRHCLHPPEEISENRPPNASTCTNAVHAEANLVAFAARHGISLRNADVYVTTTPCVVCAQLLINSGVRSVTASSVYRDTTGIHLLSEAGVMIQVPAGETT